MSNFFLMINQLTFNKLPPYTIHTNTCNRFPLINLANYFVLLMCADLEIELEGQQYTPDLKYNAVEEHLPFMFPTQVPPQTPYIVPEPCQE